MERVRHDLNRVRVVSEPFILAIPAGDPLAERPEVTIEDLDGRPFVGFSIERGGFLRETQTALFTSLGIAPRIVQEVSQTHTVVAMVNQGIGIALVPASARVLKMENVRYRDIALPAPYRSDLYLISRATRRTPLQDRMRDLILEVLAPYSA